MTDHSSLTKQRTESLLAAAQERAPHIDWGVFATGYSSETRKRQFALRGGLDAAPIEPVSTGQIPVDQGKEPGIL
jgi:hypothetical protein